MVVRPELVPDPALSRDEMAELQREIRASATFDDDGSIDPTILANPPTAVGSDEAPVVAGVDQAFLDEHVISAVVVMRGGSVVERVHALTPLEIPYVPGLLSFREGRPILEAVEALSIDPDLYLFDGSGRIHFREAGIATHMGVILDVPAIGVAKRLLCGTPVDDLENLPAGSRVPIEANSRVEAPEGTLLGYAVQTKQYDSPNRHVNPLYVSPGHRIGAETAADVVLALSTEYKLPDPVRLADAYTSEAKEEYSEERIGE